MMSPGKTIRTTKSASSLKGLLLLSIKQGKILGKITNVFISRKDPKISGFLVKDHFWGGGNHYIAIANVESIGEDVVFTDSNACLKPEEGRRHMSDVSFKGMHDHWVTTEKGKHVGKFMDVRFSIPDWKIREIVMSDDISLSIDATEVTFGPDEIVVPPDFLPQVSSYKDKKKGLFSRVFGDDPIGFKDVVKKDDEKPVKIPAGRLSSGSKSGGKQKNQQSHVQKN